MSLNSNNTMHFNNDICRDLNGNIPLAEAFRPVISDVFITDEHGEEWNKITAVGWCRVSDNYFWPADPRNANSWLNRKAPTVDEIVEERTRLS